LGIGQSIINILVDMSKRIIYRCISIIFIILTTLPFVKGFLSARDIYYEFAVVLFSVIVYPNAFLNKVTLLSLVYVLILIIYFLLGNPYWGFMYMVSHVLIMLSCLSISNVYNYNKDNEGLVLISIVGMIIIAITLISTVRLLDIDSMVVRNMSNYSLDNMYFRDLFKQGIAGYGLIHLSPFFTPLLVYKYKNINNKYSKALIAIFIFILYYVIIKSSVATPIIFINILLIISLIISKNKIKNYFVLFITFSAIVIINTSDILGFLIIVKGLFESELIVDKINDIITSLQYGYATGEVGGRKDLYSESLKTFFNNPIVPDMKLLKIGGHAYIVDRAAVLGLVGMIPYLAFIYLAFNRIYKKINTDAKVYYAISVIALLIMISIKNIIEFDFFLYNLIYMQGLTMLRDKNNRVITLR
jgi:hypothetical protein